MHLAVFGATGGIGRHVVDQALAAGHDVTAVVRDPSKLTDNVRAIGTNLQAPDPGAVERAVHGAGAVLSCLGARTKADIGVAAVGASAIVSAMHATNTRRLIVVSADRHNVLDRLRQVDGGEDEMSDVRAGDGAAASHVLPECRAVAAGQRLVDEPRRSDDGPIEGAVAHDVLHRCQIRVPLPEYGLQDGRHQIPHHERVAGIMGWRRWSAG